MAEATLDGLRTRLVEHGSVAVALSGGADSAFLAWVAHDTLGPERARAITAVSPSLPESERAACGNGNVRRVMNSGRRTADWPPGRDGLNIFHCRLCPAGTRPV